MTTLTDWKARNPTREVVAGEYALAARVHGRMGRNDRAIEVWTGKAWVSGWLSWVSRPGIIFRFLNSAFHEPDQAFVSDQRTVVDRYFSQSDPTFQIGVVSVIQAPALEDAEVLDALEAPAPRARLTYNKEDVQDV